ncbi:MAG: GNAT family N-acetyltransferase [Anaerolineales bacterium]|jgi:GNAT superfamily N-acetyltransferase
MRTEEFIKAVRLKYIKDPIGVSGFAFWKIEDQLLKASTFQLNKPEVGECLYAYINQKLVFYWAENDKPFVIPLRELREYKLLSLHNRFEEAVGGLKETHNINAYFPLKYDQGATRNARKNDNIHIVTLNMKNTNNLADVANIINETTNRNFTSKSIEAWTESRVYAPELWIGAIDKRTGDLVGVGISTYTPEVMETDLDWFYIREDYQGCGIGTMLVRETISRCRKKSHIIRVAGVADEFYKKCGFIRQDKWYYLTQKAIKVGWWD